MTSIVHESPLCPLAAFTIAQTTDVDEAGQLLSLALGGRTYVDRVADARRFFLQMNVVRLGRIALCANYFGSNTITGPGMLEDGVLFAIGHSGLSAVRLDDALIAATEHTAAVISPGQKVLAERPRNSSAIMLRVSQAVLAERFRELSGRELQRPLAFERVVDLSRGGGAMARNAVRFAIQELERDPASIERRIFRVGIEDMLLAALLGLPHRYTSELERNPHDKLSPRVVRIAEEYIEAHAGEAISVADLVRICGCSQSALFQAFHKARGYSPKQFLSETRLRRARHLLLSDGGHTVSAIAFDAGFNHLGRFAEAYRKRFGETPSATLGRRRSNGGLMAV